MSKHYVFGMIVVRKAGDRGVAEHGWLSSRHTWSFADYYDPKQMGFRSLRVINEDRVTPGMGFGTHPHRDMEIISYVIEGAIAHKDSMGTGAVLRPGEVQRMTAGTGVTHSEFNPSKDEPLHFLQIWILPAEKGLVPSYEQKEFAAAERRAKLRLVASPDAADGSVTIHQDARLYASLLEPGESVTHALAPGRHAWVQIVKGRVALGTHDLGPGDGAAVSDEQALVLRATTSSELLVFDLA